MKKNILFVLPWLPYPLNSGGRQAIANGLIAAKEDYQIFITYPLTNDQEEIEDQKKLKTLLDNNATILPYILPSVPPKRCNILKRGINFLIKQLQKINCASNTYVPNPYAYWITELLPPAKKYIDHINHIITAYRIDIVQCEMLRNVAIALSLPSTIKTVFVHHELGFVRHALELKNNKSDLFNGQAYYETAKSLEVAQLNNYNCVVTLSPIDSLKLKEKGVKTKIMDSFAIVSSRKSIDSHNIETFSLSFIGPDKHEPNLLGIKWFLEKCWNQLLEKEPRYKLNIIGNWSKKNIEHISANYNNINFLGFVEDLESVLSNTTMIVPITIGSGIRMKILEASNLGIPFVSTTVGAEGIPVINGQHCLIADDPECFVKAIINLQEPALKQKCTDNAHKLIEEYYSINALRQNRINIYKSLYE